MLSLQLIAGLYFFVLCCIFCVCIVIYCLLVHLFACLLFCYFQFLQLLAQLNFCELCCILCVCSVFLACLCVYACLLIWSCSLHSMCLLHCFWFLIACVPACLNCWFAIFQFAIAICSFKIAGWSICALLHYVCAFSCMLACIIMRQCAEYIQYVVVGSSCHRLMCVCLFWPFALAMA